MKRLFFILVVSLFAFCASAQTESTQPSESDSSYSPVIRIGNNYNVNGNVMNKKAFMGFLQSRDAVSYKTFRSAYQLAGAGWGLFAGGLALNLAAFPVMVVGIAKTSAEAAASTQPNPQQATQVAQEVSNIGLAGYCMLGVGDALTISGITCIAVGYSRMHQSADYYNATQSQRRKSSGVNVALQSSRDGIGIAFQF